MVSSSAPRGEQQRPLSDPPYQPSKEDLDFGVKQGTLRLPRSNPSDFNMAEAGGEHDDGDDAGPQGQGVSAAISGGGVDGGVAGGDGGGRAPI